MFSLILQGSTQASAIHSEHLEAFLVHLQQTRSASTAANRYTSLRLRWLEEDGEIQMSPMTRMRPPSVEEQTVPIIPDEDLRALVGVGQGQDLDARRDAALILVFLDTGARLSEVADLQLAHVDLYRTGTLLVRGKGSRDRLLKVGPKTSKAIDRYLRVRGRHPDADSQRKQSRCKLRRAMESPHSEVVTSFNVADPGFSVNSETVRSARESSWCAVTNYGLAVLRYNEGGRLLKHPSLQQGSAAWPGHHGVTTGPFARWWSSWMLNLEGEDHRRLRRLTTPGFSPRYIQTFVPRFQTLANELVDSFDQPDHCEFVEEFAQPYAARVIAMLLGAPESEWPFIAREAATLGLAMAVTIADDLPRIEASLARLSEFCQALIDERMADPRDDFITRIVQAQVDEDKLTPQELLDTLVLLVFGGFDTTRNQLGLAMQCFLDHPDQWRLLAERPELARNAVEEVMRVNPTTTWVTRQAKEDFTFDGLDIAEGTTVHLWTWSTGTDPRAVPDEGFDITADRPTHFGFGGGAHSCLGAMLARVDMSEALVLLAQRLRSPFLDGEAEWMPLSGNTGPVRLPISFTPGAA